MQDLNIPGFLKAGRRVKMKSHFNRAVRNIASFGDTDIFPLPIENHVLFDDSDCVIEYLLHIDENFDDFINIEPPLVQDTLAQVGYLGLRWATQVEPFWNAYFLSLVLSVADDIERVRVPESKKCVFSYRFDSDHQNKKLFRDSTWRDFKIQCNQFAQDSEVVLLNDIADFYRRIYHHRLENALLRCTENKQTVGRIRKLLSNFSGAVSYGLPVGGPAARLLAELVLNASDQLLLRRGIHFCRYADDYAIFCDSERQAHEILVELAKQLNQEGLSLQKSKTRVVPTSEYLQAASSLDPQDDDDKGSEEQKLLSISLRFDPYSPTAKEDYKELKHAVEQVDIVSILGREISKSKIDQPVTKQAIAAIRALSPSQQEGAILTLLDQENLFVLSPVFPLIMRTIRNLEGELNPPLSEWVGERLLQTWESERELLSLDLHLMYFVQALSGHPCDRSEAILIEIYESTRNSLVRRVVIQVMSRWGAHWWISSIKPEFPTMDAWVRRLFIVSSYLLGDEGKHWRDHNKQRFSRSEIIIRDWFSKRCDKPVPL